MTPTNLTSQQAEQLTNEELIKAFEAIEEQEQDEQQVDGSGECGSIISDTFEPFYEVIEKELDKRGIDIFDF